MPDHDGDPAPVKTLRHHWGRATDDLLRILVRKREDAGFVGYLRLQTAGGWLEVAAPVKIREEIARWLDALSRVRTDPEPLKSLSPSLHHLLELKVRPRESECVFARTARLLMLLKALLLRPATSSATELEQEADELKEKCPQLGTIVNSLMTDGNRPLVDLYEGSDWCVSLPLVMVVAVGESQCEWFRPVAWEAYSAGRARNELQRKWQSDSRRDIDPEILDAVSLFIRYQVAPGQFVRGTGDSRFLQRTREASGRLFTADNLAAALKVIGVVSEARNRFLPGFPKGATLGELPISGDVRRPWNEAAAYVLWDRTIDQLPPDRRLTQVERDKLRPLFGVTFRKKSELRDRLTGILETSHPSIDGILQSAAMTPSNLAKAVCELAGTPLRTGGTWMYTPRETIQFGPPGISAEDFADFKEIVEKRATTLLADHRPDMFSFSRSQSSDLIELLEQHIREVVKPLGSFENSFHLNRVVIPDCFGGDHREYMVEILLNDHIAAERLLFGTESLDCSGPRGPTAADLLEHLFEHAKQAFHLEEDSCLGQSQREDYLYVPFPLLERMLEIVYRLRPEECFSLPVRFDQDAPRSLHIPAGLSEGKHPTLVGCIANYVPAYVLNRAMSEGFRTCDIGLDSLANQKPSGDSDKPDVMSGEKWRRRIREVYDKNYFGRLLEVYLRDYNTDRRCVEMERATRPYVLRPIATTQLAERLAEHLACCPREPFVVLGIDVGGTLTKCQFYKFRPELRDFDPLGEPFKILTSTGGTDSKGPSESARAFVQRLVRQALIVGNRGLWLKQTAVVGICWPGPVRANRVSGASGVLERFGLSRDIGKNPIEDLWKLDIVGAFRSGWKETFRSDKRTEAPFVALVNDGDADSTGAVLSADSVTAGQGRLVVVKLGTGTAGAVFLDGRLERALNEWGKIVLDVNAFHPQFPPKWEFPEGVANAYLSAKTMPGVARRKNSDLDAIPDLDSVELGLLLEAIQRSAADAPSRLLNQGLLELLNECGIRELANSPDFGRVDVEILRRVCEKGEQSEPELFRRIEKEVVKFGWAARVALKKRVEVNGGVRLARLWGLDGEETRVLVNSSRAPVPAKDQGLLQSAAQKLDKGHELANKCAEILGDYLGDFIALICGLYDDIATVVLGGGVLRKCTGGIARRRAMERAKKYGIDVRGDPDGNFFTPVKQEDPASTPSPHGGTQSKAGNGPNPDFGTLGAAAFAAGEWLASQKQKGLNGIRAMLMRLHPNESVVISEGRKGLVVSADDQELCLDESALSKQEVVEYLDKEGSSLGFYRSSFADAPDPTFTRWVVEL